MKKYKTKTQIFKIEWGKTKNLTTSIDIKYENLTNIEKRENNYYVLIKLKSTSKTAICSKCNCEINEFHKYFSKIINFGKFNHKFILGKVNQKQYYCFGCNKYTRENLILNLNKRKSYTTHVQQNCFEMIRRPNSLSEVARNNGLVWKQVAKIVDDIPKMKINYKRMIHLGIDETGAFSRKFNSVQTTFVDLENRAFFKMLPDKNTSSILSFLKNFNKLKTITMDFLSSI